MGSLPASVITCKAVVCKEVKKPGQSYRDVIEVMDIQVDVPQGAEIRVKMLSAGICHTDISNIRGFMTKPYHFPRVLGHEGVGIVESVGPKVKGFEVGDMVIAPTYGECGECSSCKSGRTNVCQKYGARDPPMEADGSSRFSFVDGNGKKQYLYYFLALSTWTQYMVVDSNYAVKLNDYDFPAAHGCILSCAFATGYGAAWLDGGVRPGDTVAVFGVGSVGLSSVIAAKDLGAKKIIGIDKNERKRQVALSLGATDFINSEGLGTMTVSDKVMELTGGKGADCCIEASGSDALMNEAMKSALPGKAETVICGAGIFPDDMLKLDFTKFLFGNKMTGCIYGRVKIKSDLPFVLEKAKQPDIKAGINRILAYDEKTKECGYQVDIRNGSEAIYTMLEKYLEDPEAIKIIIKLNDEDEPKRPPVKPIHF
ncbi:unnamed protein product [Linum tenue]|uniref:Alcohol dehydrogenase n=1 Tax=Linum tenue TaxID=586396 RepID=A0AAV0RG64_9ROSI|nr:unnamed protein product [Linum tenue]